MITWLKLWPFTLIPFLVVFLLGFLPSIDMSGKSFGGALVREWFLNYTVLPFLSNEMARTVVQWFYDATLIEELLLHLLVSVNVWALFFPIMFMLGQGVIRFYTWHSKTSLKQKQTLLNQRW